MAIRIRLAAIVGACALQACGGSGTSTTNQACTTEQLPETCTSTTPAVSPGGLWQGTDPISGLALQGVILESGKLYFYRSDGSQYVGSVATTSSGAINGSFDGYTQYGTTYPDGSTHGGGSFSGTITAQSTISATFSFTTDSGTTNTGSGTLTFNALYDQPVPVSALAGNYTVYLHNTPLTIAADGTVSGQDPTTGCAFNGTLTIANSAYNAYDASGAFTNCTGTSAPFNGVTLLGVAVVSVTSSPYQVVVLLTGPVGDSTTSVTYEANEN